MEDETGSKAVTLTPRGVPKMFGERGVGGAEPLSERRLGVKTKKTKQLVCKACRCFRMLRVREEVSDEFL